MGKLYVVGFGPGGYEHMTDKCIRVIREADVVTGYTTYVDMLKEYFPEKTYLATPMMQEIKRCRMAVEEAVKGQTVAMVSSGDSGIYGMAGIIYQVADGRGAGRGSGVVAGGRGAGPLAALLCVAAYVGLSGAVDADRRGGPGYSIEGALASRFAWPTLWQDFGLYGEEVAEAVGSLARGGPRYAVHMGPPAEGAEGRGGAGGGRGV